MRGARDFPVLRDIQAYVVEHLVFLSRLNPDRAPDPRSPSATGLVWRLVDVAAASQKRLRLPDEPQDVRGADLATVEADVHAQTAGRIVDEPDAAPDFIGREL